MRWHHAQRSALQVHPRNRSRPPGGVSPVAQIPGQPNPPDARLKSPSTKMVREPAPRLIADKSPAKRGINKPAAITKRRPAETRAKRLPAVSIAADGKPRTVGIQVAESRGVVGIAGILQARVAGRDRAFNPGADPAIKIVTLRRAADTYVAVRRGDGKRFALTDGGRMVFANHRNMAGGHIQIAAVIKIIQAKRCRS